MKTPYLLPAFFILATELVSAQAPAIEWQKCLGGTGVDQAAEIAQTSDGGYVIVGYTNSSDGDVTGLHTGGSSPDDYWVAKIDEGGNLQWQKTLGGTSLDLGTSIQQTFDGGYIVAGYAYSIDGDVVGLHGSNDSYSDFWLIKLYSDGNIQWKKCYGGSNVEYAYSVKQMSDGDFIIAGGAESPNDGDVTGNHFNPHTSGYDLDFWIIKVAELDGALLYEKCFGGEYRDYANSIIQTADNGFISAGSTQSDNGDVTGLHTTAEPDIWFIRLDANGQLVWEKCLGGTNYDVGYAVDQGTDGNYVVAGLTNSIDGDVSGKHGDAINYDAWVVKLDPSGNIIWAKCYGGSGTDRFQSIKKTADGGYIAAGFTTSSDGDVTGHHSPSYANDYWVVKLDGSGNIQWQKCLGGAYDDYGYSVQQTTDNGYVVAGASSSIDGDVTGHHGTSNSDYWVVKLAGTCGIPTNLTTTSITASSAQLNWMPAGIASAYTLRYKLSTASNWTKISIKNPATDSYTITSLIPSTKYKWEIRQTCSSIKSDFSPAQKFKTAAARMDIIEQSEALFKIYPNPAAINFTFEAENADQTLTVILCDLSGKVLQEERMTPTNGAIKQEIDVHAIPSGYYILKITGNGWIRTQPLVISK